MLIDLSAEIDAKCGGNTEFWHMIEKRPLGAGEAEQANPPDVVPCLRLETFGKYDPAEHQLEAKTFRSLGLRIRGTAAMATDNRQLGFGGTVLSVPFFLNPRSPAMNASSMCEINVVASTASP